VTKNENSAKTNPIRTATATDQGRPSPCRIPSGIRADRSAGEGQEVRHGPPERRAAGTGADDGLLGESFETDCSLGTTTSWRSVAATHAEVPGELDTVEPRIDPPPDTPHIADVILRARRR
jgi:hypothetical protein